MNWIEIAALLSSIAGVYASAKQYIWCWAANAVAILLYIFIFWEANLYGSTALQFVFLAQTFYGFWKWKQKTTPTNALEVRSITFHETIITSLITICLTAIIAAIQTHFNTALSIETQLTDSFLTACSIVGTWMLAQKIIQNWLLWAVVDIIYIGLLYQQALWTSAINYALFVVLAIYGWYSWQSEKKTKIIANC